MKLFKTQKCIACGEEFRKGKHSKYKCAEAQGFELKIDINNMIVTNPRTGESEKIYHTGLTGVLEKRWKVDWQTPEYGRKVRGLEHKIALFSLVFLGILVVVPIL